MFKRKIEKYLKEWKSDEHKLSFFPLHGFPAEKQIIFVKISES